MTLSKLRLRHIDLYQKQKVADDLPSQYPTDWEKLRAAFQRRCRRVLRGVKRSVLKKILPNDPRFRSILRSVPGGVSSAMDFLDIAPPRSKKAMSRLSSTVSDLRAKIDAAQNMTIGEEIRSFVESIAENPRCLLLRLGLSGQPPMTLQDAGDTVGLTRERVRQKQKKFEARVYKTSPFTPTLDRALEMLRPMQYETEGHVRTALRDAGILGTDDNIAMIFAFADLFGRKHPELLPFGNSHLLVPAGSNIELARDLVQQAANDQTRDFGACNVDMLKQALIEGEREEFVPLLPQIIESLDTLEWLEKPNWFRIKRSWSVIRNMAAKILAVSPIININELKDGVQRHHRVLGAPPRRILGKLVELDFGASFDGNVVRVANTYPAENLLAHVEATLYDILKRHGGVMARPDLENEAVAAGVKRNTFYIMISYSPIIERYARGVYGLRGWPVAPGLVESLIPKDTARFRSVKDYGHLADGRLWLYYQLSQNIVNHQYFTVPSAVQSYLKAEYRIVVGNSRSPYTLGFSSGQLRVRGGYLERYGAEVGDFALLLFDSGARTVQITIGGSEILEDFLEASKQSPGEETEAAS